MNGRDSSPRAVAAISVASRHSANNSPVIWTGRRRCCCRISSNLRRGPVESCIVGASIRSSPEQRWSALTVQCTELLAARRVEEFPIIIAVCCCCCCCCWLVLSLVLMRPPQETRRRERDHSFL